MPSLPAQKKKKNQRPSAPESINIRRDKVGMGIVAVDLIGIKYNRIARKHTGFSFLIFTVRLDLD